MTYSACLQDWITVSGNGNVVTQSECDWLEIQDFQDIFYYVQLNGITNASNTLLDLQTSPTEDEAFFTAPGTSGNAYLSRFTCNSSTTLGTQATVVVPWATTTNQPPARYLRWRLTFPAGATTITFSIWLSLNLAGWGSARSPDAVVARPAALPPLPLGGLTGGATLPTAWLAPGLTLAGRDAIAATGVQMLGTEPGKPGIKLR